MSFFSEIGQAAGSVFNGITGGPKKTTTETTTVDSPKTNYGLIIGGIALAIGGIVVAAWMLGAFKKKGDKTAA